jgi:hypothetical protein
MAMWQHIFGVYVWRSVWICKLDCSWRSVWRCKLDCSMYGVLCGDVRWTAVCMAFCVEM